MAGLGFWCPISYMRSEERPCRSRWSASATTFFVNLEPLVVTGAAFLILGQTLTPLQLLGVLIVVGALIFYARSGSD